MAQRSYFFDSVAGDRIYTSADFARVFGAIAGRDGVIYGYGDELKVTPGSGMAVKVGTGAAFVQGRMLEVYDQAETLPIATADATNPRMDRVVVRVDLSTAQRRAYLAVKTGTPAATPVAPLLQQDSTIWEMSLAQVRVPAGATGVVAGNITDEREFTSTAATTLYTPGVAGFDVATVQAGLDVLAGGRIVDHNLDVASPPNGYYARWENGLQVCWHAATMARDDDTGYLSRLRYDWTFPASFVAGVIAVGGSMSNVTSNWAVNSNVERRLVGPVMPDIVSMSETFFISWRIDGANWSDGQTVRDCRFWAIGRWK